MKPTLCFKRHSPFYSRHEVLSSWLPLEFLVQKIILLITGLQVTGPMHREVANCCRYVDIFSSHASMIAADLKSCAIFCDLVGNCWVCPIQRCCTC